MTQCKVGDYVIVRDDIESVPDEWKRRKGQILAVSVVKSTVGFRSLGAAIASESNSDVFRAHYVLMDGATQPVPIDEAWLQLVKE